MKTKIKKIAFVLSAGALLAPMAVMAQLTQPAGTGLPTSSVTDIITNIMKWLLYLIGILGVIGFVIAGILYLTAGGDETRIGKAKSQMLYSIIGIVVALLGLIVLNAVMAILGGGNRP